MGLIIHWNDSSFNPPPHRLIQSTNRTNIIKCYLMGFLERVKESLLQYFISPINYHLYYHRLKSQSGTSRPVKLDCHESQGIGRGPWSSPSRSVQLLGGQDWFAPPPRKWAIDSVALGWKKKAWQGPNLNDYIQEKKVGWHWYVEDFNWPDRGGSGQVTRGWGARGRVLSILCQDHDHHHRCFRRGSTWSFIMKS